MTTSRPVAIAAIGLVLLLCGLVGLYLGAVRPDEPTLGNEKKERPVTERTTLATSAGAFTIAGRILTSEDDPVEGVVVGCNDDRLVSGPDGRFRGEVERSCMAHVRNLAAMPLNHIVEGENEEVDFVVAPVCPLTVKVLGPDGPLADATVSVRVFSTEFPRPAYQQETTDADGQVEMPLAQCGRLTLSAEADGLALSVLHTELEGSAHHTMTLVRGTRVHGTVRSSDGELLDGGSVRATYTQAKAPIGPDGTYELRLAPGDWRLYASGHALDILDASRDVTVLAGIPELQVDFTLMRYRLVDVYCAGLPEDSCKTVFPVMCTSSLVPVAEPCRGAEPTVCACPTGEAAIRGGGRSVSVETGDEAAWLDFTATGGVRGRVERDDAPFRCSYGALRIPDVGMDLIGGGLHARSGRCEEDGTFEILGLDPGRWAVEIYSRDGRWPQDDVLVQADVQDLGTIDLSDGGRITVEVVDGLTGEPAGWEPIAANRRGRGSANPIGAGGMSDPDAGVLELTGLQDGTYDVFCASQPLDRHVVHVTDGSHHTVQLTTGEGSLLDEQGFAVATDESGDLVVSELDPDGGAADAGLASGDILLGVTVAGIDVLSWAPSFSDEATRWVLENTDGSGVVLVVEREDALLDIPL
ncbi:MAG: hypothetical protein GY913_13475 [Proteobacteria bacterium]|nr:hypothetical protein [Pseudomonadota bacterium]MCP4917918.1 hypothetical protein [Pseudomonadota bacterium]